ncbi:MAG: ADP-dependent glucokinase/phosphofructokinase [Candidatus Heimdallarchaeaceae archaeon]
MKNWIEFYVSSLKELKPIVPEQGHILLGFNVNLDKIIKINPTNFPNYFSKFQDLEKDINSTLKEKIIEKKEDFFYSIVDAIERGRAEEYLVNKKIQEWIEANFYFEKTCIGGQAAIIANILSDFGYKNIVLNLPVKDERLKHLLNDEIRIPIKNNSKIKILPTTKVSFKGKYNIVHYIFEFSSGKYSLGNKKIICTRDNRFIASADTINSRMITDNAFIEWSYKNAKSVTAAILSGFHLLQRDVLKETGNKNNLNNTIELINQLKTNNKQIKIHIELASFNNVETLNFVTEKIFPIIDSIGLNEQELIMLTKIFDNELSSKMQSGKIIDYYKGLFEIFRRFPNLRIHFHFLGYYIILSKPISDRKMIIRRSSLIKASIKAFQKVSPYQNILHIKENIKNLISHKGMSEIRSLEDYLVKNFQVERTLFAKGYLNSRKFTIVAVPTLIEKNPTQLVGLGDTISSLSFIEDLTIN